MKKIFFLIFTIIPVISLADTININWYVGDSVYSTSTCTVGGDLTLPTAPTKYGYTFMGWEVDYAQLEYIESDGHAWIDTGIVFDTENTRVEIGADILRDYTNLFGFNNAFSDWQWYTIYHFNFQAYFAETDSSSLGAFGIGTPGTKRDLVISTDTNKHLIGTENGVEKINATYTGTFISQSQPSVAIFTVNGNLVNNRITTGTKVWYTRLYKDGVMVFNGVPARRVVDGAVGMYDYVSETFFGNAGSGAFIAGPVVGEI